MTTLDATHVLATSEFESKMVKILRPPHSPLRSRMLRPKDPPYPPPERYLSTKTMAAISGHNTYDPKKHLTTSGHATPRTAARPGTVLEEFVHDHGRPVIAIDLDDVLSQTNEAVAKCELVAHT